jgi:GNAT superfamily N-acetyltransferase
MDEAPAFLGLLCDVFDLDFARASAVFTDEPMFDLDRKWALFEDGAMASILTTAPLVFGWGRAIGISGVATIPARRGAGLASELMSHVLRVAESRKEGPALLFAQDRRLYERFGFTVVDEVVRGPIRAGAPQADAGAPSEGAWPQPVPPRTVRRLYDRWSAARANRLRRDARRWRYWNWNLRSGDALGDGYLCLEGNVVREAVLWSPQEAWAVPEGAQWVGLRCVTEALQAPLDDPQPEMYAMARGFPEPPAMFLTDQF